MSDIFTNGGLEFFTFELLTLSNGVYKHKSWITDYIEKNSCSINIDFNVDIVGGISLSLKAGSGINYLTDFLKVYYNLGSNIFPVGVFMLNTPDRDYDGNLEMTKVKGYDTLYALQQDLPLTSYTLPAGSNVVEAVEALIDSVGSWVNYSIEPSDAELAEDVSYELGKSKLFIINSLLNMINYYPIWSTGNGVYKSTPWVDTENVAYSFIDNAESLYEPNVKVSNNYADAYNRVIIINNQIQEDTAPLYKVWTMEDEGISNHPFSYTNIARYVTKKFDSDAVSQDYIDLRARREIHKMLEIEEAIEYPHAFVSSRSDDGLPWHGDAFRFKNTKLDIDSVYLIEKQNISLKTGVTVNSTIRRVRDWS